jgi:pimeloyl-ACP methyl ester carboxylesterase
MDPGPVTGRVQAFTLSVPESAIADLRGRLARTRFPDQAPGVSCAYGTDLAYMQELVGYWRDSFDWRSEEVRLNTFPQYKVPLHGINLHFLHVPSNGPDPCPLLLSHGWPGSVFEFLDLIPRLTDPTRFGADPDDAFTVVAPSLPGYGLSFAPGQPRFSVEAMADCFAHLMTDVLGHDRFAVQGGDWGSSVASRLGYAHAGHVIGIHLNLMPLRRDPTMVSTSLRSFSKRKRATSGSRAPGLRRSHSRSRTRLQAWQHGSSRSSAPGPIAAATWNLCSRRISSLQT